MGQFKFVYSPAVFRQRHSDEELLGVRLLRREHKGLRVSSSPGVAEAIEDLMLLIRPSILYHPSSSINTDSYTSFSIRLDRVIVLYF